MGAVITPVADSALALATITIQAGETRPVGSAGDDSLVYVFAGRGELTVSGERHELRSGTAALVLAGEDAALAGDGLALVSVTVGPDADRHAPLGPRETVVPLVEGDQEKASGGRAFQILFGPDNGSTRATLFAGFIPPGRAPWHYHLYDEIVWVPEGPGRLHLGDTTEELGPGSTFRLRPRQLHIVENLSPDSEMTVIGVFTPAGNPSSAYLPPDVAAEYRFTG